MKKRFSSMKCFSIPVVIKRPKPMTHINNCNSAKIYIYLLQILYRNRMVRYQRASLQQQQGMGTSWKPHTGVGEQTWWEFVRRGPLYRSPSCWVHARIGPYGTTVPWRYVHPQTDHVTFRPTPYVHPTFHPLWQFTIVTIRPPNILLLWQIDPMTIYYCDNSTT